MTGGRSTSRFDSTTNCAQYNRYEVRLLSAAGSAAHYGRASQAARAAWVAAEPHTRALVDVAAGVAAPLLIEYVRWVLHRAQDLGLDRLYFLARDGQVLLDIARALRPHMGVEVIPHYLHVSRVSLNLAAAGGIDASTIPWVLTGLPRLTRREFASRLHLEEREVSAALDGADLEGWGDEPLGRSRVSVLEDVLLRTDLRDLLRARAEVKRQEVTRYLSSCGFLANGDVGVVDLGGAGSQLVSLAMLRRAEGESEPDAFLVYRERSRLASSPLFVRAGLIDKVHTFVHDAVVELSPPPVSGFVPMLEAFCAADHGRVEGYTLRGDKAVPVFDEGVVPLLEKWGLREVRAVIEGVALRVAPEIGATTHDSCSPALLTNMEEFLRHPTRPEANAWGSFPLQAEVSGAITRMAPPSTFADLAGIALGAKAPRTASRWWAGSRARSRILLRPAWKAAAVVQRRFAGRGATKR